MVEVGFNKLWTPRHGQEKLARLAQPRIEVLKPQEFARSQNNNRCAELGAFERQQSRLVPLDLAALYMMTTQGEEKIAKMNLNVLPKDLRNLIKVVGSGQEFNGKFQNVIKNLPAWVRVPSFDNVFTEQRKGQKAMVEYVPPQSTGLRFVGGQIPDEVYKLGKAFKAGRNVNELNEEEKHGFNALMELIVDRVYDHQWGSYGACEDAAAYTTILVYNAGQKNMEITIGSNIDPNKLVYKNPLYRRCSELEAKKAASQPDKAPDFILLMRKPNGDKKYTPQQLTPCQICSLRVVNKDFIQNGGRLFMVSDQKEILDYASKEGLYMNNEVVPVNKMKLGNQDPKYFIEIPNSKLTSLKVEGTMGDTAFQNNPKAIDHSNDLISLGDFLDGFDNWRAKLFKNGNIVQDFLARI